MIEEPLPHADSVEIPIGKLRDYALSPEHPKGRHKARVFSAALGIHQEDAHYLAEQIREAVRTAPVTAIRAQEPYGFLYTVPILLEGLNGATHVVITAWLVRRGATPPRLTTAYVDIP